MKATVLIEIGLAIARAGVKIARRQSAKARRRYRRVTAYNEIVRGIAAGDQLRVTMGYELLRKAAEDAEDQS